MNLREKIAAGLKDIRDGNYAVYHPNGMKRYYIYSEPVSPNEFNEYLATRPHSRTFAAGE